MPSYAQAYANLNDAQRLAVDKTDGPVLVIAGPGTGKTQLLITRIAHILATTDTLAENILCLTFTDAAALNMRERLSAMIGQAAYSVTISTYHSFGNDLLRRYPEFFSAAADLEAADALRIDQIMRAVQAELPYANPLKHEIFLPDLKSLISDYKRALLLPTDVRAIANANETFITAATALVQTTLGPMPKITKASLPVFVELLAGSATLPRSSKLAGGQLIDLWNDSLTIAVAEAQDSGKTNALTAWKNRWLAKDGAGNFVADGAEAVRKQRAAATIYERYLALLVKTNLYDYDDMILQAIQGLESNPDLRFTMQERYQYLLLDEFQDTNQAQLKLVQLLTDNPVNEGQPNVLAVGDDDQAIYAFQGADYSHMLEFYNHYEQVLVVPLTENYRSSPEILALGQGISQQITERLHYNFPAISKELHAANTPLAESCIGRYEFLSDLSQNAWVSQQIKVLLDGGLAASEIAVLAPKHQYLESLVPFLRQQNIAVRYDKREDVLEDLAIKELITMSRLVVALADHDISTANALWAQVLSLPYWNLATSTIWQASWEAAQGSSWTDVLLANDATRSIALFFIRLSLQALSDPLETTFDYLTGTVALDLQELDTPAYKSPFYHYYFGSTVLKPDDSVDFWQLLANLAVLRSRLRDYRSASDSMPTIADFLKFVAAHQAANIKILNTNPYQESADAVQLMTAFKSKGQEFQAVFVLALSDDVWGSRARNQSSRIAIPENLRYIRYAGASEDERLRLLYVAFTRARTQLYLTNFTTNFSGKHLARLKYLDERLDDSNGEIISPLLPSDNQVVQRNDTTPPSLSELDVFWHERHHQGATNPKLRELLSGRLAGFQLSATQVNRFTDTSIDGPSSFLMRDLLKFPSGSSLSGTYGDIIHDSLSWLQIQLKTRGTLPSANAFIAKLAANVQAKHLKSSDAEQLLQRGTICLQAYYEQRAPQLLPTDLSEYNFRQENVFIGKAHLSGKIDRLIINPSNKTISVVDFKTGRAYSRWTNDLKMHSYQQQLYFYKLLVENSTRFRGYQVTDAYLEFVEPDESDTIQELHVKFDPGQLEDFQTLIGSVWQHVMDLQFPDVSSYSHDAKGVEQFQADLRSGDI